MKCKHCNGIGLVDKKENGVTYAQEVCRFCQGKGVIGDVGTPVQGVEQEKKHIAKVSRRKK